MPQKAFLFSGTVASNLRYGDEDATDEELWHALEIAQGRDFVEEMEGGLEAPITQGGTNVSGGQRQRLAIARALVQARPASSSSTTASRRSTSRPTRGCGRPSTRELGWATRDHRRPAGRHDHERRPDRGHGRRPGRRHRHARRAARRPTRPTARSSTRSCPRRRPRHERPAGHGRPAARRLASPPRPDPAGWARSDRGGGPGMMGMGMPAAPRRRTSGPSFRRLLGGCARKRRSSSLVIVLAVVSVLFAIIGPKILGDATNVIFEGADQPAAAGRRHPGAGVAALRPRARTSSPTCSRHAPDARPGRRLRRPRPASCCPDRRLPAELALRLDAGLHHGRRHPADRLPAAPGGRPEARPAAAQVLRQPSARRPAEPGHQRHRQHRPDAPAEPDPAHHRRS